MTANFVANGHVPLPHLGAIRVQGADARSFLNGQFTHDFALLKPGHARLTAWCSPKGRMLVSAIGFETAPAEAGEPTFVLVLWRDRLEAMLKRLRMCVLRAKVQLTDVSDSVAIYGLLGEAVTTTAPELRSVWQTEHVANADLVRLMPAGNTARALWLGPPGQAPAAGPALPTGTWLQAEVLSGVAPVMTATAEAFVPQMLNYESVDGVSFKKGCYPGQEIVARSQFRGTLKQRAFVAQAQGAAQVGDEVWLTGPDAGPVGTVALASPVHGGVADVIVSIKLSAQDQPLAIGSANGPRLGALSLPYALAEDI